MRLVVSRISFFFEWDGAGRWKGTKTLNPYIHPFFVVQGRTRACRTRGPLGQKHVEKPQKGRRARHGRQDLSRPSVNMLVEQVQGRFRVHVWESAFVRHQAKSDLQSS